MLKESGTLTISGLIRIYLRGYLPIYQLGNKTDFSLLDVPNIG